MGQLKTGILNLYKALQEGSQKLKALEASLDEYGDRVTDLGKKCDEGYDVLHLYLLAKFKKQGTSAEAQAKQTLKQLADSGADKLMGGIEDWKKTIRAQIDKLNVEQGKAADALQATLADAASQADRLVALARKKEAKWLKSAQYKAKVRTYMSVLDGLKSQLATQQKLAGESARLRFNDAWLDKNFKSGSGMTVAEIKNRASMSLTNNLKDYNNNRAEIDARVRKMRDEYKSIPGQMALLKKWSDEADEMDLVDL